MESKNIRRKREENKEKDNSQMQLRFKKKTIAILTLIVLFVLLGCGGCAYYFAGISENDEGDVYIEKRQDEISTATMITTKYLVEFNRSEESFFTPLEDHETRHLSLNDAMIFCAMKSNRKLPTPVSRKEEKELINRVKAFHNHTQCDNYLIGYKLNPFLRYKSLGGNKAWPPLKENPSASIVTNDRDCIRIQLTAPGQDFAVVDFRPCKDVVDFHCVLGYKTNQTGCGYGIGEFCFHAIYADGFNPEDMFRNYKRIVLQSAMEELGLLLFDRKHLALSYTSAVYSRPKICWALDVKYDLDYLNVYEEGPSPYNINFTLNDPEQDCLVINNDFQIETAQCNIGGCPLCEKSQILKKRI